MEQLVILQNAAPAGEGTFGGLAIFFPTILLLLVWVGFIFLNGRIAKWKGYPFWAGAISGIVLFWGTLLFLVMPFNRKKRGEKQVKCPFCKEVIQTGAIKCKHCNELLSQEPTPMQQGGKI